MNIIKWLTASVAILFTGFIVFTGRMTDVALPTASASVATDSQHAMSSKKLDLLKTRFDETDFDSNKRDHLVRKQRIAFYIDKAVSYHQHDWVYNRDDAIERAYNILNHHDRMESSTYASL